MIILIPVVIMTICILLEFPTIRQKRRKVQIAWGLLWFVGFLATSLALYKIKIPSPLYLIIWIYQPVNNLLSGWL